MLRTLVLLVTLIGTAAPTGIAHAQEAATPEASQTAAPAPLDDNAAAAYCIEQGGVVRERVAVLNPDSPQDQWVVLGASKQFCEFTGGEGADPDTWISISLDTLYAEPPTLAALAYLTKPALPEMTDGSNPSATYCLHLGGAYGLAGSPGGWVTDAPAPATQVESYCVFGDGSMIDAWGLTYHTGDVIRGADLAPILRYQSDTPPSVFPDQP